MRGRTELRQDAERIEFSQVAGLRAVRLLSVERSWHRWSLFHEAYAVTLVSAGCGGWRYRRRDREIEPGGLMLIEPGDVHVTTRVGSAASFETLFIDPATMAMAAREGGARAGLPHFDRADCADAGVLGAFRRLTDTLHDAGAELFERQEAFEVALGTLLRRAGEATSVDRCSSRPALLQARALLHDLGASQGGGALSMAEVAQQVGLAPIQLIRGFKAVFGLPPYQYLVRVRLARAQRLIHRGRNGGLRSLTDVAQEAGFCDLPHMDKHFRRLLHVSPTAYAGGALGRPARLTRGW